MSGSDKRRTRRHRRQERAQRRAIGGDAKPKHRLQAGRTGKVGSKKTTPKSSPRGVVVSQPRTTPESVRLAAVRIAPPDAEPRGFIGSRDPEKQ